MSVAVAHVVSCLHICVNTSMAIDEINDDHIRRLERYS